MNSTTLVGVNKFYTREIIVLTQKRENANKHSSKVDVARVQLQLKHTSIFKQKRGKREDIMNKELQKRVEIYAKFKMYTCKFQSAIYD